MGRYETLNIASQNLVDAVIPGIMANFGIDNILDVIPEDVRMRTWDCDRREWVFNKSEDDARNWGLQFLKDLLSISRVKAGKLDEFQEELQEKIDAHEDHPWAKLQDIKDIKDHYDPPKKLKTDTSFTRKPESSGESSSDDSYFEELVEIEEPGTNKRRHKSLKSSREKERYESRRQEKRVRRNKRLRRDPEEGWARPVKRRDRRAETEEASLASNLTPFDAADLEDMPLEDLEDQIKLQEMETETLRLRMALAAKKRKEGRRDAQAPTPRSNVGTPASDVSVRLSTERTLSSKPAMPVHMHVTPRPVTPRSLVAHSKARNPKASTAKTNSFTVPESPPPREQGQRKRVFDEDYDSEEDDDDEL